MLNETGGGTFTIRAPFYSSLAYNAGKTMSAMTKDQLAIRVRPCRLDPGRFRWDIMKDGEVYVTADKSFDSFSAAMSAGNDARSRVIERRPA